MGVVPLVRKCVCVCVCVWGEGNGVNGVGRKCGGGVNGEVA